MILLAAPIISCSSASIDSARQPAQTDEDSQQAITPRPAGEVENGPYDDCDQRSLFEQNKKFNWACTGNYVHIFPKRLIQRRNTQKIKFGGFNLYHLGDDQGRLKDLNAVALIMNQWDIVGATELMPLPTDYANENRKLREIVNQKGSGHLPQDWRVVEPGYYRLLKALQKLDTTWSLIFQPTPEGEGSTGEMAGFYYRARRVQPKSWNYCPVENLNDKIDPSIAGLNFGCVIKIPDSQAKFMSRKAFVAAFQSGKFDFIAAVSHTRFRPPANDQIPLIQAELCSRFDPKVKCAISKDKVGRFYEVKAIADQFPALEAFDRDVIYLGDFNLEPGPLTAPAWSAALGASPGYEVFQTERTSLSLPTQSLLSSYDHFILRPSTTTECDLNSIRPYDFTQIGNNPKDKVLARLSYLLDPATHFKTIESQQKFLLQQIRLEKNGSNYTARGLTNEERKQYDENIQRAVQRLNNNKFWVLREYLSDHVPIEMTCKTSKDDD